MLLIRLYKGNISILELKIFETVLIFFPVKRKLINFTFLEMMTSLTLTWSWNACIRAGRAFTSALCAMKFQTPQSLIISTCLSVDCDFNYCLSCLSYANSSSELQKKPNQWKYFILNWLNKAWNVIFFTIFQNKCFPMFFLYSKKFIIDSSQEVFKVPYV